MSTVVVVYNTAPNKSEALSIARTLLDEKLIACANIIPNVHSIYSWQGKTEESEEVILLVKTLESQADKVMKRIKELHSYDCPCIMVLTPQQVNTPFQDWVEDCVDH